MDIFPMPGDLLLLDDAGTSTTVWREVRRRPDGAWLVESHEGEVCAVERAPEADTHVAAWRALDN